MKCDLRQGDCLELMKQIPDGSVDMVLCDPPYGCLDLGWDNLIDGNELFEQLKRICKRNSNVLLFCNMSFAHYLLSHSLLSEFSHCLIWQKKSKTRFKSVNKMPMSQYEMILVFCLNKYGNKNEHIKLREYFMSELDKSGKTVKEIEAEIPNHSAHHWFRFSSDYRIPTEENYKRLQEVTGCFHRPYTEVRQEFDKGVKNERTYNSGIIDSDILTGELTEEREHPTQKPVKLLKKLLLAYSNTNEVVLDFTMGSGSTGVACVKTGRNFIGIELDPGYFEIAKKRIEDAEDEMRQLQIF